MGSSSRDPLEIGEVHVWTAAAAELPEESLAAISPDERRRAGRFHFEKDRRRYVAAHHALRNILSRYLGKHPVQIGFTWNGFGKPFLSDPGESGGLSFNMSHSGELTLVAVTRGRLVGVDVEFIRPVRDFELIAADHFTPQECMLLDQPAGLSRESMFFTCWTRKEAYIKAIGKGLSIPLNSFDTSIPPGAAGRRLACSPVAPQVAGWWLVDLVVPPSYAGALVIEEGFDKLSYRQWPAP